MPAALVGAPFDGAALLDVAPLAANAFSPPAAFASFASGSAFVLFAAPSSPAAIAASGSALSPVELQPIALAPKRNAAIAGIKIDLSLDEVRSFMDNHLP